MRNIILTIVVSAQTALSVSAGAPPVRSMYVDAMAKEQAVRKALTDPGATEVVLKAVHEAVGSYESVVRHYPASSYSDDALWNAGRLEMDAFARFHQPADRDTALRLLNRLVAAYPTSKLARQAPAEIARAATIRAPATPVEEPPPTAPRPVPAPHNGSIATLRAVHRTVLPDTIRVTIDLDGEVPFHDERIADPDRVFVDLASTRPVPALADQTVRFDGDGGAVRQVRVGRHPNSTTRVVLDAIGISSYSVFPLYDPYRLVIDCVRASSASSSATASGEQDGRKTFAQARTLVSRRLDLNLRRPPSAFPQHALSIAEAKVQSDTPAPTTGGAPAPPPLPPAPTPSPVPAPAVATPSTPPPSLAGGFSIARQLGLGVSRIVIDPGHGGHDPGAKGKGVTEAELVLDVALRVEKLLTAVPGVEVILTRRTDDFVALQDRTAIANREGADLFLSIHANASPSPGARGVETYFLNFASNLSAAAVAARENAASGQAMGALPDFVKAIALNNKLDESKDFATQVQRAMVDKLHGPNKTLKDLGVKQAPFVVLIGAAMPSVLAEISFVTNAQEARLLKSNAYRQKIAEALFNAIRRYQTSLKTVQTAAQP
jgi:N-acetylmuramoyl-L-alanine amidase